MNLRTYDRNSLVLYINDNLNNFIQLYVENGTHIVFKFNDGNEVKTLSVEYPGGLRDFMYYSLRNHFFDIKNYLFIILIIMCYNFTFILTTGVSSGQSIQVAVIRNDSATTLHVNDYNASVESNHRSLSTYSNRPWINPEKGNQTMSYKYFFFKFTRHFSNF